MDVVADVAHEVGVNLSCLMDHPPFLSEKIDGYDGQCEKDKHEPASLECHVEKVYFLLVRNNRH